MIFPPSFFDIMIHLAVHLPREALLAGPVQFRWMYPIERFLGKLKRYVRNRARPEGSIAEAYIDVECLTFCSMYFHDVETRFNRVERNTDIGQGNECRGLSIFSQNVRPLGSSSLHSLDERLFAKAQWYVLNNCTEIERYLNEHHEEIKARCTNNIYHRHEAEFPKWFKQRIKHLHSQNAPEVSDQLYALACGPDPQVAFYNGCIVNGVRFHTKECERNRCTQCSGVLVKGEHEANDVNFYGILNDILELHYLGGHQVFLFNYDWWDIGKRRTGIQIDNHFTSINISRVWYKDDPFVLACQASQVFYLNDNELGGNWRVVDKITNRNIYDAPLMVEEEDGEAADTEAYQENEPFGFNASVELDEEELTPLLGDDVTFEYVDVLPANNTVINEHLSDEAMNSNTDEEGDSDNQFYAEEDILVTQSNTDTDDEL
ncbi:hypothetical protein F2P56_013047 [Juglans regia]|uniref:DUF4218 domain-containing protein n=1 Tax=Juglans regia TaxID=51240 RepID=A0A834CRN0_JUGRE|nr:hypothetical protein F2P56_013047 [Juglans regia]